MTTQRPTGAEPVATSEVAAGEAEREIERLTSKERATAKLLETECSLSQSTMAAMFSAQRERDQLRAELERLRPIVDVAVRVRDLRLSVDYRLERDERSVFDELSEVIDSYRSKP